MRFANFLLALTTSATSLSLIDTLSQTPSLSILHGLLQQFNLLHTFNTATNITLLAPTNEAYIALAKWGFNVSEVPPPVARALLTYHLLDGVHGKETLTLDEDPTVVHTYLRPPVLTNVTDGAAVKLSRGREGGIVSESGLQVIGGTVETDIQFSDGVLHTLNSSLVLPHNVSVTAELNGLTAFLDAVERAKLVSEIESQADVTVFIPLNDAIRPLRSLMDVLPDDSLAGVLRYHVIPGRVLYHHLVPEKASSFKTLQGSSLTVKSDKSSGFTVNNARVVRSDLLIYGGVAHIVDELLVPRQEISCMPETSGQTDRTVIPHFQSESAIRPYGQIFIIVLAIIFIFLSICRWKGQKHPSMIQTADKKFEPA